MGRFETTRWSVVLRARGEAGDARAALEQLCRTYRPPVLAFVRFRGYAADAAEDLTQAFFTRFLERAWYSSADPERGRFRTFLLTALKRFLIDADAEAATLKRGGGVRLMVLGEIDLRARDAEVARDDAFHPELLAERVLHRLREARPRFRERAERGREDALELEHRLLVEDDGVEIFGLELRLIETPFDRVQGKRGVVLLARKALFLDDRDGHAVDHERGGGVVIVRGEAEDLHRRGLSQYCERSDFSAGSARAGAQPGSSFFAVRFAMNAKIGRMTKYCTARTMPPITFAIALAIRK